MTLFYDPADKEDQLWVEKILQEGGVEYFLLEEPVEELGPRQIHVAEEDEPRARKLLMEAQKQK
ncbi:MAG: DUF2007 domain-containing protein [Desulfuromonadales bacterium]